MQCGAENAGHSKVIDVAEGHIAVRQIQLALRQTQTGIGYNHIVAVRLFDLNAIRESGEVFT